MLASFCFFSGKLQTEQTRYYVHIIFLYKSEFGEVEKLEK